MNSDTYLSNEENLDIRVRGYEPDGDSWLTIELSSDSSGVKWYMSEQQARDIVTALSDGLRELESQRVIPEPERTPTCVHCGYLLEAHPASSYAPYGWWEHAITADNRHHGLFCTLEKHDLRNATPQASITAAEWLAAHPQQVAK